MSRTAVVPILAALLLAAPLGAQRAGASPAPDTTARSIPTNLAGMGPGGATLRCRDGSYPVAFAPETACDGKGGVLIRFRVRGTPPPPAAPVAAPLQSPVPVDIAAPADPPLPPSRANVRIEAEPMPRGTTLICGDGTYVVADTSALRCASRGGVKVRFATRRP